jgi:glycosyltransferase 2 family protein
MQRLSRGVIWVSAVAALLYVAAALYTDVGKLRAVLGAFQWWYWAAALGLSLVNYAVRVVRWQMYLRVIEVKLPLAASIRVFIAGFALSASPGKVGELLKSWLLKRDYGVPVSRTGPIVLAERLTDFLGLSLLSLAGLSAFRYQTGALLVTIGVVALGTAALGHSGFGAAMVRLLRRWPRLHKPAQAVESILGNTQALLRPKPLWAAVALATLGWGVECVGFYLILKGFGAQDATLLLAVFVHAASSILGAISMLPGGVGLTEALMIGALVLSGVIPDQSTALAATILNRFATLWFAVILGFIALALSSPRPQPSAPASPPA